VIKILILSVSFNQEMHDNLVVNTPSDREGNEGFMVFILPHHVKIKNS